MKATITDLQRHPAFGLWADRGGEVDAEVRALRQG